MRNDFTAPNKLPYDDAPPPEDDYYQQGNATGGNAFPPAPEQTGTQDGTGEKKAKPKRKKYMPATNLPAVRYSPEPETYAACVEEASKVLANLGIYDQGARLSRIVTVQEKTAFGRAKNIRVAKGTSITVPVTPDDVLSLLQKHVPVERWDAREGAFVVKEPPQNLVKGIMLVRGDWPFKFLSGIVNCPCLRADGSIVTEQGYDEASGLYVDFHGVTFPEVNPFPAPQEVKKAWALLEDMVSEFPFARGAEKEDGEPAGKADNEEARLNKSVALSAFITAVTRHAYSNAPMFAVSAHTPCSGKTTLATLVGIVATGCEPAAITVARTDEEFEKALFALVLKGAPVCLLDNISRAINTDMLCSILTQPTIEARVLGATRTATASTTSTVLATGNNLQVTGDLIRRTMLCQLDRNEERPDEHLYSRKIDEWVKVHRPEIVHAILTIVRAYHVNGHKIRTNEHPTGLHQKEILKPLGSFEDWSDWVRGPLVDAGYPDPLLSRRKLEDEDPEKAAFASVLEAWNEAYSSFGGIRTVSSIFKDFENTNQKQYKNLQDALENAIPHYGDLRPRQVGKWFEKKNGCFAGGYQLVRVGRDAKGTKWRVNPPKL